MKKNRGFTLIELLATIIILAGIALVAFPILLNTIKNSEGKIDETTRKLVENAAKLYIDDNANDYPKRDGNVYCIPYDDLVKSKHLEKGVLDAANSKSSINKVEVTVSDQYTYELVEECNEVRPMCTLVEGNALEIGSKYLCSLGEGVSEMFYVLETGDTVSLIMDRNYVDNVAWGIGVGGYEIASQNLPSKEQQWNHPDIKEITLPSAESIGQLPPSSENCNVSGTVSNAWLNGSYWTINRYTNLDPHCYGAWYVNGNKLSLSWVSDESYIIDANNVGVRPVIVVNKDKL